MNTRMLSLMRFTMMGMFMTDSSISGKIPDITQEDLESYKQRRKRFQEQNNIRKGLKEFEIDGYIVWALNEKNAKRKVKNILKNLEE